VTIQNNTTLHVSLYILKQTNLPVCVIKYHAMRTYGGDGVQFHAFLTPVLDEGLFFSFNLLRP